MPTDTDEDESGPSEGGIAVFDARATFDAKTVAKIAKLARLQFDDEEVDAISKSLGTILTFVGFVRAANLEGVPPTTSLITVNPRNADLREDIIDDGGAPDRVLANAPEAREGFFVVPKVVE